MDTHEFSQAVIEKLGWYVYLLTDPETGKVFYIGKGTANRIFAHENEALVTPAVNDRLKQIRAIQSRGLQVRYEILRHGLTEREAFEVEAALIDFVGLPELTNQVLGFEATSRGWMTIPEILAEYEAIPVEISEPSILVIVNRLYARHMTPAALYEITRGNWVVGERRVKAKYAFAVYRGIVREVYRIQGWSRATARSPQQRIQVRWRFDGEVAQDLRHYVGGSVGRYLKRGAQSPVKYVNC